MERETNQRKQILEVISNCYTHPNIKELSMLVKEKYPSIGQATVYRTVNKLVKDGIVTRIDCSTGTYYDFNNNHYHFRCLHCGKISDIYLSDDVINKILSNVSSNKIIKVNLVLEGICEECSKGELNESKQSC